MTENIMQCCYTNAIKEAGGKISSGWQAVVVSENLPSEAYVNCVNLQNANSAIQSHMVDENGNVLNLFEITGDGAYVYVSRTQYGLTDRLGRPNMFSHAYIFSWKQENVISDPNVFLTLTGNNFAKDEESARRPKEVLERTEPLTLERALDRAGIPAEKYLVLIQCVYAQYSERKSVKPLYVQYDGTNEQMQAILYCIYYGLPYGVRRNLSAASGVGNSAKKHHLIFSQKASAQDTFLIPQTGENNVLTPRIERRIARSGFVEYAVRRYPEIDMNAYFQQLERLAVELGDAAASDELILKIAHQMTESPVLSDLSDQETGSRLSDALRSKTYGSQRMEEYISSMLDEVCRRKMCLTEESEANLKDRLSSPVTERLAEAGEQYHIYRLSALSNPEAAKLLRHLSKPVFDRYSQRLVERDRGMEILDTYYAAYGLEGGEVTWDALQELLTESGYVHPAPRTRERIEQAAWDLYRVQIERPGEVYSGFDALMRIMEQMLSDDQMQECRQNAKSEYWETQSLQTFRYRLFDEYKAMRADLNPYKQFEAIHELLDAYARGGDDAFFEKFGDFIVRCSSLFVKPDRVKEFRAKLEDELVEISAGAKNLFVWIDLMTLPEMEWAAVSIQEVKDALRNRYQDIQELRNAFRSKDFEALSGICQQIIESERTSDGFRKALGKSLHKECLKADTPADCLPLDVWLVLGSSLYPDNAFRIFDGKPPCILSVEEMQAVNQSRLLGTQPYLGQAEEYVRRKGTAAKIVSRWLNERRVIERRKAKENKTKDGQDSSVRALFSHFAAGTDSRAGWRLPGRSSDAQQEPAAGGQDSKKTAEKKAREKKGLFGR